MDSLPLELLENILLHVDKRSLPPVRLVCHIFDTLTFPILFHHIPQWLNYEKLHRAVLSLAHDVYNRPAVMWSPWATGPDGPVDPIWMGIVWRLLMKSHPPGSLVVSVNKGGREERAGELEGGVERVGDEEIVSRAENFARLSGEEMTENRLRTGQNRFLMHRSYSEECAGQSY